MRAEAIEGFWALIALFLDEQRAKLIAGDGQPHGWAEDRSQVQSEHRLNLLKWLQQQFEEGHKVEELNLYLAV